MRLFSIFFIAIFSVVSASCRALTPEQTAELYSGRSDQLAAERKGPFVLVVPERIEKRTDGTIVIHYRAPCDKVEFASRVILSNDSENRTLYLGIVHEDVPHQCQRGPLKDFDYQIDSQDPVYATLRANPELVPITSDFVLVGPHIVKKISTDKFGLDFDAPCSRVDSESIVTSFDDSGDFILSVGIVYDKKRCKTGDIQTIQREFDRSDWPELFAELGVDNADVFTLPMKVR